MKRRLLVAATGALLTGLGARRSAVAQEQIRRVGLLSNGAVATAGAPTTWRTELIRMLAENGFSLGKNLQLVDRYAEGRLERLPLLAREIGAARVDVVLAITGEAVRAMLAANQETPIVMVVGYDPVALGFVASLARPGGRVTGLNFRTLEGDAKRLELLREALPRSRRLGILEYRGSGQRLVDALIPVAAQLNIELTTHAVSSSAEYATAFTALKNNGAAGVLIESTQALATDAVRLVSIAEAVGLPTICEWDFMARVGCMLSYGHDLSYAQRRAGEYVARILKGASPAELPVEQSDAWKLTINLGVATRLGLTIPPVILVRADEVIE